MRLVIAAVFAVLAGRLILVQGFEAHRYAAIGAAEVTATEAQPALRGGIYDRNGAVLAMTVPTDNVIGDPLLVHHPRAVAAALAPLLGTSLASLEPQLASHRGYVVLARQLSQATGRKVLALHLPGITLQPGDKRIYPGGQLASSVLGSVGAAGQGQGGLEYEYNNLLTGTSGSTTLTVSPSGVPIPGAPTSGGGAHPGRGIELTIDQPLQYVAEQALGAEIAKTKAKSGIAIVMDVHTGDILAMANLVNDPATGTVTQAPSNLALTQVYEPGSVFKLVTFSAALQDGIISPTTPITIPPSEVIDGWTFHDAESHPTETLSATEVLAQSSNLGTIHIAQQLGANRLAAQVAKLGFGKPTGLHFPGSSPGLVLPLSQWNPTTIASTPIGEVDAVNAQQLLDMFNAVADGGVFVPPRLVRAVVEPDGTVQRLPKTPTHRVIAASADAELTSMMEQVVSPTGTAPLAGIPGYTVAGKTGTSNVPRKNHPGYVPGAFYASFAGFAPAESPQLSAVVMLKQPTTIYGGSTAAPVFAQIMRYALHRYGVPPSPDGGNSTVPAQPVPYPAPGSAPQLPITPATNQSGSGGSAGTTQSTPRPAGATTAAWVTTDPGANRRRGRGATGTIAATATAATGPP